MFMPFLEKNDAGSGEIGRTSTSYSVENNVNKLQYFCQRRYSDVLQTFNSVSK